MNTQDFWHNVKIVDATELLVLFPQKCDIENAVPGDPEQCMYARCAKRTRKVHRAKFYRNIALIEDKDEEGQTIARRYTIGHRAKRALTLFDQGAGTIVACTLLPPSPSWRLDEKKKAAQGRTPEAVARARLEYRTKKAAGHIPVKRSFDPFARSGSGTQRYAEYSHPEK
jgi:hypothetical protein